MFYMGVSGPSESTVCEVAWEKGPVGSHDQIWEFSLSGTLRYKCTDNNFNHSFYFEFKKGWMTLRKVACYSNFRSQRFSFSNWLHKQFLCAQWLHFHWDLLDFPVASGCLHIWAQGPYFCFIQILPLLQGHDRCVDNLRYWWCLLYHISQWHSKGVLFHVHHSLNCRVELEMMVLRNSRIGLKKSLQLYHITYRFPFWINSRLGYVFFQRCFNWKQPFQYRWHWCVTSCLSNLSGASPGTIYIFQL